MKIHSYWFIVFGYDRFRVSASDPIDCSAQYLFINAAAGSDATSSLIRGLLHQIAVMSSRPFPFHFMPCRGCVQPLPPFVISLTTEAATHCFDDITRVGEEMNTTRLEQRLQ